MLLAIDTATQHISAALHSGRELLAEQTLRTDNQHNTALAPLIASMLDTCGVRIADLRVLAVCTGPGSFTGLRIGVAFAKGLAAPGGLPLVGLSALDILAAAAPYYSSAGLIAVVPAGRGRIIVNTYRWRKGRWGARGDAPQIMTWDTLLESIDGPAYLTGEISAEGFEALLAAQERQLPVNIVPAAFRLRRAGFLAEEALNLLAEDGAARYNAAKVVPVYVKTDSLP